jgi:hypothetical protein
VDTLSRYGVFRLSSNQFYASIPAFDEFSGIADSDNYRVAPDDWHVIIADVKGSTRAIAEGRYKDVNMIGAACINAVLNISQKRSVPYVFGGDGATLMVHSGDVETAARVLFGVRDLAANRFNLAPTGNAISFAHPPAFDSEIGPASIRESNSQLQRHIRHGISSIK